MKRKLFSVLLLVFSVLGSADAFAAKYDIKEMTPQIQAAFDGRKSRYQNIQQLKASGALSENNEGLVSVNKPEAQGIAAAENADRMVIYQAIVSQNNLGPNGLAEVKRVFAEIRREKDNA